MAAKIDVDLNQMRPGETRLFTVYGSEPLAVEVKCFVTDPPPPSFRPCPACGSQKMKNGGTAKVFAPPDFMGGSIHISVEDADGDRTDATIEMARTQQRGMDMEMGI